MSGWLLGGVLGLSLAGMTEAGAAEPKAAAWLNDNEQAKKAARASGKPIFAVFR
jgi:hypothetical protein